MMGFYSKSEAGEVDLAEPQPGGFIISCTCQIEGKRRNDDVVDGFSQTKKAK